MVNKARGYHSTVGLQQRNRLKSLFCSSIDRENRRVRKVLFGEVSQSLEGMGRFLAIFWLSLLIAIGFIREQPT